MESNKGQSEAMIVGNDGEQLTDAEMKQVQGGLTLAPATTVTTFRTVSSSPLVTTTVVQPINFNGLLIRSLGGVIAYDIAVG